MDTVYLLEKQFKRTNDSQVINNYSHDNGSSMNTEKIVQMIMSESNINDIVELIIERVDPTRNGKSLGKRMSIVDKVRQFLNSWVNLGKFERINISFEGKVIPVYSMSIMNCIDYYNKEFVNEFAETILPYDDPIKVSSVVNPNGLYAHQQKIIKINSKPVPFYERALYKRLHDTTLDSRIDETESPFYRMDHNERMKNEERKKRDVSQTDLPSYQDREAFSYRMKPNY